MKLKFKNEYITENHKILEFDKIINKVDSIICILDGNEYCKLKNIQKDDFYVEGGEFEPNREKMQQEVNARLLKDSANLQIELNKQKEINATLLVKIAQLGGNI